MEFEYQKLFDALNAHDPFDQREEASKRQITDFITAENDDRIFNRESQDWHITGSAFVIYDNKILFHYHKKINKWIQPGGHVDHRESAFDAAVRECFEETGVEAIFSENIFHVDVHDVPNGHKHFDIRYFGLAKSPFFDIPDDESKQVAWFNLESLEFIDDVSLVGAINKLKELDY